MVDFQSRDTRRGPTDGDDEADEEESSDDEPSTTEADPEAADSGASDDATSDSAMSDDTADGASGERPGAADSISTTDSSDPEPAAESPVAKKIDEAASDSTENESVPAPQEAEQADGATQEHQPENGRQSSQSDDVASAGSESVDRTAADADTSREQQVAVGVVTVGTATEDGDPTGEAVETALEANGQTVTARERLRGDYDGIQGTVDRLVGRDDVEVVITAGGLGVAPSEHTLEAVHALFEKALPGFEEVYRSLLFEQQGTGVIAVRPTAGIADGTPVFCLPGDPAAARLAVDEIIAAEAASLVAELS